MAIQPCKECGGPVSDQAESCPRCGAKQVKKTSPLVMILTVLLIIGAMVALFSPKSETDVKISPEKEAMIWQANARVNISKGLKNPDSAKFDENYKYGGCGRVNSKNSFGAYTGFKRFYVDEKAALLEDFNMSKSEMDKVWKQKCS